jgi:hypothetical protein
MDERSLVATRWWCTAPTASSALTDTRSADICSHSSVSLRTFCLRATRNRQKEEALRSFLSASEEQAGGREA